MTPDEWMDAVSDGNRRAVLRYASPDLRDRPHCFGRVIAYCDAPMICIEDPTGARVWWRADLAELADAGTTGPTRAPADQSG